MTLSTSEDFYDTLSRSVRKQADYSWMWALLRMRAAKHGGMFPERAYRIFKKFGNPQKPYFVGTTSQGVKFLGDYRDLYSVLLVIDPSFHADFIAFICDEIESRSGSVFIDVGANMGVVAASVAKRLGDRLTVVAIEPLPETAKRTAATIALNKLTNVHLFQGAISKHDGMLELFHKPGHSDRASVHEDGTGESSGVVSVEVASRRLDSLLKENQLGPVSFIKIDVEGHEPSVILGATETITRDCPAIVFEYVFDLGAKMGWEAKSLIDQINNENRYDFFVVTHDGRLVPYGDVVIEKGSKLINIVCRPKAQHHA